MQKSKYLLTSLACTFLACSSCVSPGPTSPKSLTRGTFDVHHFGAKGDGKTLDTKAINNAIAAAHAAGGGTVLFSAGTYLSTSIHLQSNVTLYLAAGSILEAASEKTAPYDAPEPNAWDKYQDFGHSHWHNSFIWGENLENIAIVGTGTIYGKGLYSGHENNRYDIPIPKDGANKALALKNCHNVLFRDFAMLHGGHFAILATGVDNFTIDNLKLDTNRDGMDIDACHNVRVSNCSVNTPWDDGICLKSSFGLGFARATENVTIDNCFVTGGLIEGTMLDGTFKTSEEGYGRRFGRIKFGTESNGGFKNITVSNCTFDDGMGLAIETVDGGIIDGVTVSNLTMRNIVSSPIFIRLGARLRGPDNPQPGIIRRINISNVEVSGSRPQLGSLIAGLAGHPIEDVRISNMHFMQDGGGTKAQAALVPPENEKAYPEPDMFGDMPSYGFFIRHATGVDFHDVEIRTARPDARPAFYLWDVQGADFQHVKWQPGPAGSAFLLKSVTNFTAQQCPGLPDTHLEQVDQRSF